MLKRPLQCSYQTQLNVQVRIFKRPLQCSYQTQYQTEKGVLKLTIPSSTISGSNWENLRDIELQLNSSVCLQKRVYYRGCLLEHKSGNLEISALASRHLHRHDYQHCKKFKKGPFEFLEALVHFCFLKRGFFQHLRTPLYNNHGGALFKYTCGPSWEFPKKPFRAAILYRICYRLLL